MLKELSVEKFINEASSKAPVPGGGSVAALVASLSAALSSMVFNITIVKKSFFDLEEHQQKSMEEALLKSELSVREFVQLMEKDAEVFKGLMDAFKLPKDTEEEISFRKAVIEKAYAEALKVPQDLALKAEALYDTIDIAALYGSVNVVSDASVSAILLHAAIESAIVNIKINLSSVKDPFMKEEIIKNNQETLTNSLRRKNYIVNLVNEKI